MSVAFDFKALSDQVRDQLLADPFFASIPATSGAAVVISEDPHDIVTAINAALNNIGLGILVLLPVARTANANLPGPYFDDVRVTVKIIENPTINRAVGFTNPTGYAAAMMVCSLLHFFAPDGVDECFSVTECIPVPDENYLIWQVTARTEAGLVFSQPPIAPVTATPGAPGPQNVTLACATPGAPIFYTLDRTYPSPRQGTLYTTPVAVAAGQLLCARAWMPGYAAPNPTETNLQY